MQNLFNDLILSIVQAITELFPISSSGHLIIASDIFHIPINQLLMTFLHFWTALAIIAFYFKTLIEMLKTKEGLIKLLILGIATIPAALAGVLFDNYFEILFYSLLVIGINSVFWGIIMIIVEKKYNEKKFKPLFKSEFLEIIVIGIAQTLALIPGTSRSGVTTLTGLVIGKDKKESLDIAFLLGIPITLGPFIIEAYKARTELHNFLTPQMLIAGVTTFVVGFFAIKMLTLLKEKNYMTGFGIYRVILGLVLILITIF
jgi:undecaprenyl-diphosphatase